MINLEKSVIGIELGSTRIKAVLLDENFLPAASGSWEWENRLENGIWTYPLAQADEGIRACYADLKKNVREKFSKTLTKVGTIGISGMMHGYLPFDAEGRQLAEFRTWRNTMTGEAAEKLTSLFGFNIPQRWSIAHLYQAMLNKEAHVPEITSVTTLAGYVHERLTGLHVVGIGEASGMFPIDSETMNYDASMLAKMDVLTEAAGMPWKLAEILPAVLPAGTEAGYLTKTGASYLDPDGDLCPGILLCPPEGDAGTGMTATNSVRAGTGNVSAGTSDFAMVVVDKQPGIHREIDMVTTPAGKPVAMVHCNNCTSDINAWAGLLGEFAGMISKTVDKNELYTALFNKALEGDADCDGLITVNYLSGEGVTGFNEGRPMLMRRPNTSLSLANFWRSHLMSALATLKIGMDILASEGITINRMYGHGGFFKTPLVGQRLLSAAIKAPVTVMQTAGEGGPYGMALLAAFALISAPEETLEDFLEKRIFASAEENTVTADEKESAGFDRYIAEYRKALAAERVLLNARF